MVTDRTHLAFALALHRLVAPDAERNACWSPYSVASALGMAAQAARGETKAELLALLVGDPAGDVRKQAELLVAAAQLDEVPYGESPTLSVANTLWAWSELPINEDFVVDLAGWPGGRVRTAPFRADPDGARRMINADVADTTMGLIPELIPSGAVDEDTVASLVNALYLRAAWRETFAKARTESRPFHGPAGTRPVATMCRTGLAGYAAASGWQVVTVPAAGGVDAVVLLPDGDLAEAEAALDADRLAALLAAPTSTRIELFLPKVDVEVGVALTGPLRQFGVERLFTGAADLTALSPDPRLCVSDVLHRSVLRIDEEGLEGAAATAVLMRTLAMMGPRPDPPVVRVDRPFLLLVRHAATGAIYFLTRITQP
ncbi:serpin family protein [Solihabitans fulvus]|uniref:Serpin family protein n=1 Tax=Solihabitans fulvus TaxID=1892852 RepID=A0A5B2XRL2_9PSEU|nr:serpin family protein [Solihabitans fulvus]KAA2266046.1 serpin family protein [Solihabitans fulvus]